MHKIYDRWPARTSHSANAVYRVTHTGGTSEVTVNQKLDGTEWNLLGTFSLNSANSKVTLLPQADGTVAADAVKAVKTDEASRIFYVHADHLNASRVVLDHQNRLRWRWLSDPFGQLPPEDNPSGLGAFELNLRLPGQVFDRESNLHYNTFRDYDPSTGRYVQSDPIGTILYQGMATQGLAARGSVDRELAAKLWSNLPEFNHSYAYAGGNPLSKTDSLGLFRDDRPGGGGDGGGGGVDCSLMRQTGPIFTGTFLGQPVLSFLCTYNCRLQCPPAQGRHHCAARFYLEPAIQVCGDSAPYFEGLSDQTMSPLRITAAALGEIERYKRDVQLSEPVATLGETADGSNLSEFIAAVRANSDDETLMEVGSRALSEGGKDLCFQLEIFLYEKSDCRAQDLKVIDGVVFAMTVEMREALRGYWLDYEDTHFVLRGPRGKFLNLRSVVPLSG